MKTDRELLELAAKAAGIEVRPHPNRGISKNLIFIGSNGNWNPLSDDGDALRLAVALGLEYVVDRVPGSGTMRQHGAPVRVRVWANWWHKVEVGPGFEIDLLAAVRLAIVRAAAAIGEAMK
jgi:hypothetical protein